MQWLHDPMAWKHDGDLLTVQCAPKTDFWRITHNGAIADNGHFYYETVSGDFEARLRFQADYRDLYDQAGLMLRIDAEHWLKCGIEYIEGSYFVSAVVTNGSSDWSVVPLERLPDWLELRLKRYGTTIELYYRLPEGKEQMLRQTSLPLPEQVQVGPMCAAPIGEGFEARFRGFQVVPSSSAEAS